MQTHDHTKDRAVFRRASRAQCYSSPGRTNSPAVSRRTPRTMERQQANITGIHQTQAGLPLRGRPSQDRVRSVMCIRQDRQDSQDHATVGRYNTSDCLPDSRERRGRAATQLPVPNERETDPRTAVPCGPATWGKVSRRPNTKLNTPGFRPAVLPRLLPYFLSHAISEVIFHYSTLFHTQRKSPVLSCICRERRQFPCSAFKFSDLVIFGAKNEILNLSSNCRRYRCQIDVDDLYHVYQPISRTCTRYGALFPRTFTHTT